MRNEHSRTAIAASYDLMRLVAQVEMFGRAITEELVEELAPFMTEDETGEMITAARDFVIKLQNIRDENTRKGG